MTALAPLGRGWAHPIAAGPGGIPQASGPEKVRQSIVLLLDTEPGERLMRPAYGCPLRSRLQEPNSVALRAQIQRDVERALEQWEPRVQVTSLSVLAGADPALVLIDIAYVHVRDGRPDNLVYPFYLG